MPNVDFAECVGGDLMSWIAPPNSGPYLGYTGPGYTEEFYPRLSRAAAWWSRPTVLMVFPSLARFGWSRRSGGGRESNPPDEDRSPHRF